MLLNEQSDEGVLFASQTRHCLYHQKVFMERKIQEDKMKPDTGENENGPAQM